MIRNFDIKKTMLLAFIMVISYQFVDAQVQIEMKTEYIGKSDYRKSEGEKSEKVGDSQGAAMVHQANITIPLSLRVNENKRPTLWAISMNGTYAKLDNKNLTESLVVDKILNIGINLSHLRPLNDRWSMLATVGGGIFMPDTDFSQAGLKNVLGNVGTVFIRHLKPNLDLGGGIMVNNSFGFPMVFPALYLNWKTEGKYAVRIALMQGLEMSVGYDFTKNLRLNLIAEMNGQTALLQQEGKDKMFSHLYMIAGFRPEIKIGKKISIPLTIGMNLWRPAQITDRTLKSMFQDKEYYFRASPYASAGLKMHL
ncbi:DUF6268 family outer membrane beta-barrel protein [Sphingobacterium faecium]|uniref:DUF6268 family outer membrane beta-barrel protein n=2 Tax=Sphingobacterium faecium TaxID=34087 RepID=UPI0030EC1599